MESSITSPQEPLQQVTGKRFGIRAGAYVIDVIVIWIVSLTLSFIAGIILGLVLAVLGREINFVDNQSSGLNLLIGFILSTFYFMIFEWLFGATPGKLVLGMRVIMENGELCTLRASFVRALLRLVDGFFFGLPALSSMKEPLFQRIGDKSAETIVVGAKDTFIQRSREWWWFLIALGIYLVVDTIFIAFQILSTLL